MQKIRIGKWEIMEEDLIRTEEGLVDFLLGWDFSDWEWEVPSEWEEPHPVVADIYPITLKEILDAVPSAVYEEGEWLIYGDVSVPFAIRKEVALEAPWMRLFMVRVRLGLDRVMWHSSHKEWEEAWRTLEELQSEGDGG